MPNPRSRPVHERLAIALSLLLWSTSVWLPLSCRADESTAAPKQPVPTEETLAQLRQQIGELESRVQGMQGKLRESALARKTADQARMDAERRLAEGSQALEQAHAELETVSARQTDLEQALAEKEDQVARLGTELRKAQEKNAALTRQLEALRERLPATDGGTLTADAARQAAADTFAELREHIEQSKGTGSAKAEGVADVERKLHKHQLRLGSLTNAQSVYKVRARDSLALISSRFYGSSAHWRALFDANRHLLDDPDQLTPGMTLVIP